MAPEHEVPPHLRGLLADFSPATVPFSARERGGRGVVMCAGGELYLANAFVALRFLREVSKLPVELFHAGPEEIPAAVRESLEAEFAPLRVRDIADPKLERVRDPLPVADFHGYQIKPFALLHCDFDEVVLLDADNVPLADPALLFESPEYRSCGALFWPDLPEAHFTTPELLSLFEIHDPTLRAAPEFESGQMALDLRRCWHGLVTTCLANSDRQGIRDWCYAHGNGDKDLFRLAFEHAGSRYAVVSRTPTEVGTRMVDVPIPSGRFEPRVQHPSGRFRATGMLQYAPDGGPLFVHKTVWPWQPRLRVEQLRFELDTAGAVRESPLLREIDARGNRHLADFMERFGREFGWKPHRTLERWAIRLAVRMLDLLTSGSPPPPEA